MVNAQRCVSGRDRKCTVACWKWTLLAGFTVVVLETVGSLGPVVRLIENQEMASTTGTLVPPLKPTVSVTDRDVVASSHRNRNG